MTDHASPTTTHAAVLTTDPLLACHLFTRFAGLRVGLLTRLPGTGEGHLRDTDALLVIPPGTAGGRPRTVYIGTDLDDHTVWRRAAHLRADAVVVLPDADGEQLLCRWLTGQADPAATTEPDDSDGDLAQPP
jgi:hypothetical protein